MASTKKAILLRIPQDVWEGLGSWARDELRSINAQIEYVLRDALRRRGMRVAPDDSPTARSDGGPGVGADAEDPPPTPP